MKSDSELPQWSKSLRDARTALGMSRKAVSGQLGMPVSTIRSYEEGRRHPSREVLARILEALRLDRVQRDHILVSAGFAPDGYYLGPAVDPSYAFTAEEAERHVASLTWPAFVIGDQLEVVCANEAAQRLWGIDLLREFPDPYERNMLSIASDPRFADRVANWDEMLKVAISIFKGHHLGKENLDSPSPPFSAILERFLGGDPHYVGRLVSLWAGTPAASPKVRWEYPVVWRGDKGLLRFLAVVNAANEPKGLSFNDWIPLDGATWGATWEAVGEKMGR